MSQKKALERLQELLDAKDAEIEGLQERLDEAERRIDSSAAGWSLPVDLHGEQTLPVPRLELVYEQQDDRWYEVKISYRLVYRHLLGHHVAVPFSCTTMQGHRGPPIYEGKINLPIRDGVHIDNDAKSLNLPAYAICGDHIDKLR